VIDANANTRHPACNINLLANQLGVQQIRRIG
jgi:hypothetical protein